MHAFRRCGAGRAVLVALVALALVGSSAAARADAPGSAFDVTAHGATDGMLPVEQFISMWGAGKCDALAAMLAPSWTYDVTNTQNASGPPFTITRETFLAPKTGFCWRLKFAMLTTNAGRVGMTSYANTAGYELMPATNGSTAPGCLVPHSAVMTATVDASGNLTHTAKSFDGPHFSQMLDHCAKGTKVPVPSRAPGAMPVEQFVGMFWDLINAGQCDDSASLESADFQFVNGPGTMPLNRAATHAVCAGYYASTPASVRGQLSAAGNGTVVISGGGGALVKDSATGGPCGVAYPISVVVRTRPAAGTGEREVWYAETVFDATSLGQRLVSECHWVPPATEAEEAAIAGGPLAAAAAALRAA